MHKHQQFNFFSNVVKYVGPTYGNKEELAPLTKLIMTSSGFCVKFLLANRCPYNCQPVHQSFTLRVTIDPIGHFAWSMTYEFYTEVSSAG